MCVRGLGVAACEDTGEVLWLAGRTNILLLCALLPTKDVKGKEGARELATGNQGIAGESELDYKCTQTTQHKQDSHLGCCVAVHETSNNCFRLKSLTRSHTRPREEGGIHPFPNGEHTQLAKTDPSSSSQAGTISKKAVLHIACPRHRKHFTHARPSPSSPSPPYHSPQALPCIEKPWSWTCSNTRRT